MFRVTSQALSGRVSSVPIERTRLTTIHTTPPTHNEQALATTRGYSFTENYKKPLLKITNKNTISVPISGQGVLFFLARETIGVGVFCAPL